MNRRSAATDSLGMGSPASPARSSCSDAVPPAQVCVNILMATFLSCVHSFFRWQLSQRRSAAVQFWQNLSLAEISPVKQHS